MFTERVCLQRHDVDDTLWEEEGKSDDTMLFPRIEAELWLVVAWLNIHHNQEEQQSLLLREKGGFKENPRETMSFLPVDRFR